MEILQLRIRGFLFSESQENIGIWPAKSTGRSDSK